MTQKKQYPYNPCMVNFPTFGLYIYMGYKWSKVFPTGVSGWKKPNEVWMGVTWRAFGCWSVGQMFHKMELCGFVICVYVTVYVYKLILMIYIYMILYIYIIFLLERERE